MQLRGFCALWLLNSRWLFKARAALTPGAVAQGGFDAVLIATDHDAVDYGALLALNCPVIDTRNAIARRGLDMERVVKV